MLYQNIIFIGIAFSTTIQAAVTFYGSSLDKGDYVTCQFKEVADEYVSAYLDLFYPGQIVDGSNDFAFEEPMTCGYGLSHNVQKTCQDMGGSATCIPVQEKICLNIFSNPILCLSKPSAKRSILHQPIGRQLKAPIEKPDSELELDKRRSVGHALERRDGAKCNEWTFQCRNEYQSMSSYCSSGYILEEFPVKGTTGDIWCSKACTEEEQVACKSQACTVAARYCETDKGKEACHKALLDCPSYQIKMDQSICSLESLGNFGKTFENLKLKGLTFKDGYCSLSKADLEKVRDSFTRFAFGKGFRR
jgi:hypothetical protein